MPARKGQSASSHVKPKVAVRIDTEARSQNANSAPRIVTDDDRLRPKRGSPLGTWVTLGSVVVLVSLLAGVIAFLLGPEAAYIHGVVLYADGGIDAALFSERF